MLNSCYTCTCTCTCTCRFVHSFTCAGILPSQYINFSQFAGIGNVGHKYIKQGGMCIFLKVLTLSYEQYILVYNRCGYIEVVGQLTQDSMQAAVDEIQGLPEYPNKGEVHKYKHVSVWLWSQSTYATVGNHRCQARLHSQCIPHHGPMPFWKVMKVYVNLVLNWYFTCSTMKIVGLSTLSRTEHSIPQTRELECTKIVLPQVKDRG